MILNHDFNSYDLNLPIHWSLGEYILEFMMIWIFWAFFHYSLVKIGYFEQKFRPNARLENARRALAKTRAFSSISNFEKVELEHFRASELIK